MLELLEVDCEWNYSNPTGHFNLSLPHMLARKANYTFESYQQDKNNKLMQKRQEEKLS